MNKQDVALQQQEVQSWAVINKDTGQVLELVEGRMPAINRARAYYANGKLPAMAVRLRLQVLGVVES